MGWEYFPTFPLVSVPSYCPPPLGPLTRELSSTKSPLRPLGNLSTIGPETKKTLTPKLPRNSHRTPPCGTLLRCFRALLMPLRMKLNPKVGVFFQPSKNGRGHVFWPNVWTWAPPKKNTFEQILHGLNWNSWNTIVQWLYQCFAKCLLKCIDHFCKTISEVPIEAQMVTTYGHTARAPLDSGPNSGWKHGFYGFGRWHLSFECENRLCWWGVNVRTWIWFFWTVWSKYYLSMVGWWVFRGRWEFWMPFGIVLWEPNWRDLSWS